MSDDKKLKTFFVKEFSAAYKGFETPYLVQAREHFAVKNSFDRELFKRDPLRQARFEATEQELVNRGVYNI